MGRWPVTILLWPLAAAAATALAAGALLVWVLPHHIGMIVVDGRAVDLGGAHAGHWLVASLGVFAAIVVVAVVVPSVVLVAVTVPLLLAATAVAVVLALAAVLLSPLILLLWWWLRKAPAPAATIAS